jgi:hypothetical protein
MRLSGAYNKEENLSHQRNNYPLIRICLPLQEAQRLDHAFRQESDPKVRERLLIVRLA